MSVYSILILILFVISIKGLKCRYENDARTQEEFEDVVRNCLRMDDSDTNNRKWGNKNWNSNDRRNPNNGRYDDDYQQDKWNDQDRRLQRRNNSRDGTKENENRYHAGTYWPNKNTNNNRNNNRYQNQNNQGNQYNPSSQYNPGNQYNQGSQNQYNSGNQYNKGSGFHSFNGSTYKIGSLLENVEPCIIHCMFQEMRMVNEDSYLEQSSVLNVLTKRVRDRELREFMQNSIKECFENMDDDNDGICEYSKTFALCLEEKGKSNCDDWDLGSKQGNSNYNTNHGNIFQNPPRG